MTKTYTFTITVAGATNADAADDVRDEVVGSVEDFTESNRPVRSIDVGPLVEIEMCQLVGVKDGREVDLGDIPLTPELKAREIARQYGDIEGEDDFEGQAALGAMQELIKWMNEQGKLK